MDLPVGLVNLLVGDFFFFSSNFNYAVSNQALHCVSVSHKNNKGVYGLKND